MGKWGNMDGGEISARNPFLAVPLVQPLMEPPPFWVHDSALYMAKKEVVNLRWESEPHSSKKLKGKVLKAGDIGPDLAGGGRAPSYAHVDDVQRIGVPSKREGARRIITEQKNVPASGPFCFLHVAV